MHKIILANLDHHKSKLCLYKFKTNQKHTIKFVKNLLKHRVIFSVGRNLTYLLELKELENKT